MQANYRLNKYGMRLLPPGWRGAPRASGLNRLGFDYNPKVLGHVNERVAFHQFGRQFVERKPPACIWEVSGALARLPTAMTTPCTGVRGMQCVR